MTTLENPRLDSTSLDLVPAGQPDIISQDPISPEMRQACMFVVLVVVCGVVSLLGMGANLINILVFVRQGFQDSVNISLFGLAVSDLASLTTTFWSSILYNPEVASADLPFNPMDVLYLTGGFTHACFNRITSFVTAFVTLERCLCITLPLKVRNIFTPFRTKLIIFLIFVVIIAVFSPFYYVNKLEWTFHSSRNRTILSLVTTEDRLVVETVTFLIHSVVMSTFSFLAVIVCTCVLAGKLVQKSRWRQTVVSVESKRDSVSTKEKKVVKMVASISVIFIVCLFPATVIFLTMSCCPEFGFGGRYQNTFYTVWSFATLLENVNSSINIFIYLKMSSKFKLTFVQMFWGCRQM